MWIDQKKKNNQKIVLREKEEDNISIPTARILSYTLL